ncbi:MAG TPA: tandem-95 repeat protein [Allosphingosinicella sp.]
MADVITGNAGDNRIDGGRGDDLIDGGAGDDILIGGRDADTLIGGDGVDTVDYTLSVEGVTIDLADGSAGSGDALGDSFTGVEIIQASYHDDTIRGDGLDNRLRGGRGADVIDGRGGFDTADYARAEEGVTIDLSLGLGLAGEALGDTLFNIEKLLGSVHSDLFIGSSGTDVFDGGFGDDDLRGGFGSDLYLFGFDSSEDVIKEAGDVSDVDRIVMSSELAPKDVSLLRQGDDLFVEIERDDGFLIDTILVKDHFRGAASGIEQIAFTNGVTWDRERIETMIRVGRFNAEDDIYRFGVEDQVAIIDPATLILNDVAEGWDKLVFVSVQKGRFGTASIRDDGMIEFRPAANHNGDAFFDYTVRDEFGRESTGTVEVNLSPRNDAPTAVDDDVVFGVEDVPLRIRIDSLLANDFDIDNDFFDLRIVGIEPLKNASGGNLDPYKKNGFEAATHMAGRIDGAYLEFHGRPDHFGFAGFIYTLADSAGATSKAKVEVYFSPVNDAPRAEDKTRTIRLEQTSTISLADVMAQVYDVEGDAVSFVGLHLAANGSAATNGNVAYDPEGKSFAFTPDALGEASFRYDVIDARGASSTLTYKIKVRPLNDAPVARNDNGLRTLEDQVLIINPALLLANDSDENGDTLIFTGVELFPDNGKVRINEAGMIVFSPRSDYNGSAGFEYYISDGRGGTAKAYVSITIMPSNEGPILRGDVLYTGQEDTPATLYVIPAEAMGNDIDRDGDPLFFKRATVLGALDKDYLSAGVQISAKLADGSALPSWLSFDSGSIRFQGTMPSGAGDSVSVDVWVHDPASGSTFSRRFALERETLAGGVSRRDAVLGGYIIRQAWESGLEFGAETLGAGVGVTAALAEGGALPGWLSFDAESLRFTGIPPEGAAEAFEVVLTFTHAGTAGQPAVSLTERMTIDPAQPQALAAGIAYDSDIALFDIGKGSFSANLIGGRPLPDWLSFDPETMTVGLTGFAPEANAPVARLQIVFTPDSKVLPDGTYASTDRGFTLEFVIDPRVPLDPAINAILANSDFFAAQGLFAVDLGAAASISAHRESTAPLPAWLSFDAETLTFAGTPPPDYVGTLPVRIDIAGNGSTVPTMSVITDAVVDSTFRLKKVEGLGVATGPERLDIKTPTDFNGAVAVSYHATDEKGGVSAKPAIIVFNIQPTPEKPDGYGNSIGVRENESVTVELAALLANDFDRDGHAIRAIEVRQPANGSVTVNLSTVIIDPPASLVPAEGAAWSATLADGSALPAWMSIDAATGKLTATVPLDVLGSYGVKYTMTNGASAQSAVATHAFDGNAGVTITYVPRPAFSGEDGFSYVITDDRQGTGTAKVTVDVAPVADAPIARTDTVSTQEETPLLISPALLLANDSDVDGDPITFLGVLNATHGTVSYDGTNILFTPNANFDGRASFEYLVTDNVHGTSVGKVNVNVASTNSAPIAAADVFETVEDVPFEFTIADLLANDSDPDGDSFRFVSISRSHPDGRIIELPGGRFQFVPDENANGAKSFSYTITDGRRSKTGTVTFDVAAVNDAPIANPDGVGTGNNPEGVFVGDQDLPLTIDLARLIANDRDVEGDGFTLVEVFDGDNGIVVRDGNNAVFTGREGYYGDAGFHYRVTDVHGATSTGYVSLTIMPEFELPIAVSDAGFELLEDGYIDLDPAALMANDHAPEGTSLTFLGFKSGAERLDNGLYRITPSKDFFGTLVLTYTISNGADFAVPTTVTITVLPVSDRPFAGADSLATAEDEPLTIFTTQLLANDGDVDRQAITLTRILASQGVTVEDNGIGQLIVTPDADFNGDAWFDYEIEDSTGITATARVKVTVAAVNEAPAIGDLPLLTGLEDSAFAAVLPADLVGDIDGDVLVVEVRGVGGAALPEWLSYDRQTRTLSGLPPADFNGNVVIEISADDGTVETIRQVVVAIEPVNDRPVLAAELADASVAEDHKVSIALPAGAFTDVDGDPLVYSATLAGGEPLPSWLSLAGGVLTGTPPADFNGALDIVVTASDGALSVSDTFRLTIDPVNDSPTLAAAIADSSIGEDRLVDLMIPEGSFTDVDGDTLALSARLADGSALPEWLSFANGRFTGMPPADFNGSFDIEVTATDGSLGVSDVFRLTIAAENDRPVVLTALADARSDEDEAIEVLLPADAFADIDGDTLSLTAALVRGEPLPEWLSFDGTRFTGTPPSDFNGVLDIEVTASDGSLAVAQTFRLSIHPVNDRPTLEAALADRIVPEDSLIDIAIPAGTFADVDGDALTLSVRLADGGALPAWLAFDGARLTGTPPADFNGILEIEVFASDGLLAVSDRFRLTVTAENDPPVLLEPIADASSAEDQPVDILLPTGLFGDVDGDALTLTATLAGGEPLPAWLSFDGARFTGTPPANFNGAIDILVSASDGALSVGDTFRLTIDPVNDRPTLEAALADVAASEDSAVDVAIPLGTFADVDGDSLTLTATLAGGAPLPGWLSFDGGRLTGTPPADFNGILDIEVTASDGVLTVADTFRLTISAVNDRPVVLAAIADAAGDEDQPVDILIPAGTFGDVDGDALTVTAMLAGGAPLPAWLSFDGARFTGTPPADFNGSIDIEVTASDGVLTVADTFRLTINPVNDAPTLESLLADIHGLEDMAIDLLIPEGSFADLDGDALTLSATLGNGDPLPAWLSFDGTRFTGTPPADFNGAIDLIVTASDGKASVSDAFTLTIDPVNDRPVLAAALANVAGREDFAIDLTLPQGSFVDVDGDQLTLTATLAGGGGLPAWLSFENGRFTGTPPLHFSGSLDIEVLASDGALAVSDVFRLTISPENDPPVVFAPLADAVYAEDHSFSIAVPTDTFRDADGDVLTLTATLANGDGLPAWMSFSGGRIAGTPPADFNGSIDIKVTASDGAMTASDTFRLTILAVNDAPTLERVLANVAQAEDMAIDIAIPAGSFLDVDADSLTLSARRADGTALPAWLQFDGERFTGTPPANFNGFILLEVFASDGLLETSATFRLTIDPVNDGPVLSRAIPDSTVAEDSPVDVAIAPATFADIDGDILTLSASLATGAALPTWLRFENGRFTGTPPANFHGSLDIKVAASDGQATATETFTLTVTPVNDAPVAAVDIADSVKSGGYPLAIPVLASAFTDVDGDDLTLTAKLADGSPLPSWLSFDGTRFTGTPPRSLDARYAIQLVASDGRATASQVFELTITPSNSAPTVGAAIGTVTIAEDSALNFAVPASAFTDPDGDTLLLTATQADGTALPAWLAFDGTRFTGTPPANHHGSLALRVAAGDGEYQVAQTFALVIAPVNDAPTAVGDGLFLVKGGDTLTILAAALLENDSDVEGDALSVASVANGAHGLVRIGAVGEILYTPDFGFVGDDSFQYSVSDGSLTATATVTVKVSDPFAGWQQGTSGSDNLKGNLTAANEIFSAAGNDHVKGGKLVDKLAGGDGDDHLQGMQGDDLLYGMAGDDKLNGGDGFDTAVLAGDRSTFVLTTLGGELRLTDTDPLAHGDEGTDVLVGIERLSFRGGETLSIASPIVLDLDGDGTSLVAAAASEARFDMDGDGKADDTSWFGGGDAILFLDRDGNGTVTNAKEFSFVQDAENARSDLEGLRAFDSNKDGKLSAADARFGEFRLWQDRDGDGVAAAGEISTLAASQLASLSLTGTPTNLTAPAGSAVAINTGEFTRTDGSQGTFADAALTYFSGGAGKPDKIEIGQPALTGKGWRQRMFAQGSANSGPGLASPLREGVSALVPLSVEADWPGDLGSGTAGTRLSAPSAAPSLYLPGGVDPFDYFANLPTGTGESEPVARRHDIKAMQAPAPDSGLAGEPSAVDLTVARMVQTMAGFAPMSREAEWLHRDRETLRFDYFV